MKLSVVIPVFNEKETIEIVLGKVQAVPLDKEIIVVDDGSTDGTWECLTICPHENLHLIRHSRNRGKGASLRAGFAQARGDIVIVQDGDLEYDPRDFESLVEPIRQGLTSVVYGSRFLGQISKMRILNRIANFWLTWLTNLLFDTNTTDACTCYKAFRREVLEQMDLEAIGFEICHELSAEAARLGYRILEVPIVYAARTRQAGKKVKWTQFFKSTWALLAYRYLR